MGNDKLKNFVFNQQSLDFYSKCPLKFRKCCLDGLRLSSKETLPKAKRESLERGTRFHLEAERYFNALSLSQERDRELKDWVNKLQNNFSNLQNSGYPEYQVFYYGFQNSLTAKYDLLIYKEQKAVIYDWKTNRQALAISQLNNSWQTCLYRYLLVQVSEKIFARRILPEQVTMIYWNPIYPEQRIELPYNQKQFLADERKIKTVLEKINNDQDFLQVSNKSCLGCEYSLFCQKKIPDISLEEDYLSLAWSDVEVSVF